MTHTFTDEEYQEYLKRMEELDGLREWKARIISGATQYMEGAKGRFAITDKWFNNTTVDLVCWHEEAGIGKGYCDWCPLGWIFHECPFGRERNYSK
jgi:hypothetical protein